MKILVGMPDKKSWGGPISSEPPFVEALNSLGIKVREEVFVYGDTLQKTPLRKRVTRVLETAFRLRRVLKKEEFDLIHLNTAWDLKTLLRDSATLFILPKSKAKIFLKLHGSIIEYLESKNLLVKFLTGYLKKRVDGFGVHTAEEKSCFLRAGFDEDKFFFVKNVIPLADDLPEKFSREIKPAKDILNFLFVSRFIPAKGLVETICALGLVHDKGYKFFLHCVGDGETRAEAESEAERLNIKDSVNFTGYIKESEVSNYFFKCDALLFPTRHSEGFPNILFKAVAVGMPIITTQIRAAADYLKEPENCLFCEPQNEKDLAEKIITLIENQQLRETMSKNNLRFGQSLTSQNIAKEFIEIYSKIISS